MNTVDPIADASLLMNVNENNSGPVVIILGLLGSYVVLSFVGYVMDCIETAEWKAVQKEKRRELRKEIRAALGLPFGQERRRKKKVAKGSLAERIDAISEKGGHTSRKEKNGSGTSGKNSNADTTAPSNTASALKESSMPQTSTRNIEQVLASGAENGGARMWRGALTKVRAKSKPRPESQASAAWSKVYRTIRVDTHFSVIKDKAVVGMMEESSLVSILFAKPHQRYSRPQRLAVLFCLIMGDLAVSALFYGKSNESAGQQIIVSIICFAIMYPIEKVFVGMFLQVCDCRLAVP